MKPKILILPTYFPTIDAPIVGSMVKEQSELMQEFCDIRIAYCLPGMGLKRFLLNLLIGHFFPQYKTCDDQILSGSIESKGVYYFQSKLFNRSINNRIKNTAYRFVVTNFIKNQWTPELIHSRTAEHTGLQALYLSKIFSIPNLLTENCIFIQDDKITIKKIKEYRSAIEGASKVAVVSHYLKAFLLSHKFNCNPYIIGNMVDEDVFTLKNTNHKLEDFTIFTAAHTGFTKDWNTFFKTIEKICKTSKIKNLNVEIAITQAHGESSIDYLAELAFKHRVLDYCQFKIQVPRDQMVQLFHNADVFLSTSINETFGIATLEAMFCGLPVVSTRNGGIEDFSTPENSILCNIGDHEALSNAIVDIYENKVKFNAETVRNSVINKYGKDAFKKRLKNLYENTIAENRRC